MQPAALGSGDPGPRKDARAHAVLTAAAVLLGIALVAFPPTRTPVRVLWAVTNVLLYFFLAAYAVFHPRVVGPGFGAARVWAFCVALVGTLLGYSSIEMLVAEIVGWKIPGGLMLFGSLALFLILLPPLLFNGMVGAAAGSVFATGAAPPIRAQMGTTVWWLVSLAGIVGMGLLPEAYTPALLLSAPVLTAAICRGLSRRGLEPRAIGAALLTLLSRRLIWRRTRAGKLVQVDFRGVTLGACAAVLVLLVSASGVLVPVQSGVLVSLIRLRNESLLNGAISIYQMRHPEVRAARRGIVLLRMDPASRRKVLTSGSEAALQAEVIRKLQQWSPRLVVLPAPVLDNDEMEPAIQDAPRPDEEALKRCERDLPLLEKAIRGSTRLVLSLPSQPGAFVPQDWDLGIVDHHAENERLKKLAASARLVGQAGVAFLGAARLPAIPTQWRERPPVPAVIAAAATAQPLQMERLPNGRGVRVAGRVLPEIAPNRLLVEFVSTAPGRDFATVPYASVLTGEPIYDSTQTPHSALMDGPRGEWLPPGRFFRDRIVFLDSLAQPLRDTPMGVMPLSEIQANATATLISDSPIRGPGPLWFGLLVFAAGAWVGWLCNRRRPLDSVWRALGVALLVGAVSVVLFLQSSIWLDPVTPTLAITGAFLLATQLTFEVERSERNRNRALLQRFVAPQLVDQMLADPDFDPGAGGQRRQVCVVFADVRNFTGFAEQHSPEEVIEVTNRYLGAMTDAIHAYGGILDKYTGDGLMAFFLETVTAAGQEEPLTVRAVQAAVLMQHRVAEVSAQLHAEGREPLQVGIGMHYGEAVVGFVGNANRLDYTALGHTVVVSQRLQSIAGGGEVVISETVFRTISGRFSVEPGEPVQVKGLSQPVTPYRVAAWPAWSPPQPLEAETQPAP